MPSKRVSINISLPNRAFKKRVLRIAKLRGKKPSVEFVDLYMGLYKNLPENQ